MSDYRLGCRLPARTWADFNRRVIFERPELRPLAAPFPPAELMWSVSGHDAERDFAQHGAHFWEVLSGLLPRPLHTYSPVLDLGCGCGRLARLFLGHPGAIQGCDIDRNHLDWLKSNLAFVDGVLTEPNRPLPYDDHSFELITAISVLTHVDEASQDLLLSELARVVKRGGTLLLTVHGHRALLRTMAEDATFRMLDIGTVALLDAARSFAEGRHSFILQPQGHLTTADYRYGVSFQPEAYIRSHWSRWFDVREIARGAIHDFQDVIVLSPR